MSAINKLQINKPARLVAAPLVVKLLAVGLLLGLAACRTSHQMRSVEESGFLGDYSQLQPGVDQQAKLIYINGEADWKKYTKVYIAPVQLWQSEDPESPLGKLSDENKQILIDYLHTSLYNALSTDYQIVNAPGPNVLVVKTAITTAKKSRPVLNFTSSVMPMAVGLSYTKRIIFGKHMSVGEAQVEMELLDGESNTRLAAAVDRRAGTKALRTKFDGSFGDVKIAFDYWAGRLQTRLAEERTGATVVKTEL